MHYDGMPVIQGFIAAATITMSYLICNVGTLTVLQAPDFFSRHSIEVTNQLVQSLKGKRRFQTKMIPFKIVCSATVQFDQVPWVMLMSPTKWASR